MTVPWHVPCWLLPEVAPGLAEVEETGMGTGKPLAAPRAQLGRACREDVPVLAALL